MALEAAPVARLQAGCKVQAGEKALPLAALHPQQGALFEPCR